MPEFLAGCHYNEEEIDWPLGKKQEKKREDINRSRFNDNKFATSQILKKPVEVVKGGISFSWLSSVTGEILGHNRWIS
jgi:hypothetical protein